MRGFLIPMAAGIWLAAMSLANAAEPINLSETTYRADLGVIIMQVNWGRKWKCGQYQNAQVQALTFTKSPIDSSQSVSLDIKTPSKLFVNDDFVPYVFVLQPGEYFLTSFDVKIARSMMDVAHIIGSDDSLMKGGKPVGGSFVVNPGEAVYIGHFGLDCAAEPFLWRYYIEGREDFERYTDGFRQKFPFMKDVPVQFRLFSTQMFGNPYSLGDMARPAPTAHKASSENDEDAPTVNCVVNGERIWTKPSQCDP